MQEDKKAIHAAVKKQNYPLCSARLIGCVGREGAWMPFPTTTALPLLSCDMHVCVHTHTHKYTLLRSKVISLPLLFPIRKNLLSGNTWKR